MNNSGKAWLLSVDGQEIEVFEHPDIDFEADRIADIMAEYGTCVEKAITEKYRISPDDDAKKHLIGMYLTGWCRVRVWGIPYDEIIFRISGNGDIWRKNIDTFLTRHPELKGCKITIKRSEK